MRNRAHRSLWIVSALALLAAPAPAAPQPASPEPAPHWGWTQFAQHHDVNGDGTVTRDELLQTSDVFQRLDRDGDGVVTEADFTAIRQDRLAAHLFRWADQDRDGRVTRAEWNAFTQKHAAAAPAGVDLQALFTTYDKDGDGVVALADLGEPGFGPMERMGHSGRMGRGGHGAFGERLFARFDTDGDGRVSLDEWQAGHQALPVCDPQRAEERFKLLDTNGDGFLTPDELPRTAGRR